MKDPKDMRDDELLAAGIRAILNKDYPMIAAVDAEFNRRLLEMPEYQQAIIKRATEVVGDTLRDKDEFFSIESKRETQKLLKRVMG